MDFMTFTAYDQEPETQGRTQNDWEKIDEMIL